MANLNKSYGSLVKTAYGDISGIAPNATVSVGETLAENIDDPYKIHTNVIKQGKPGADDQLANVKDITYISSFADRVMNVNDPAFGQRYSDAVREPALEIENIRKTYDKVPTYAKQSSLYRITRKVQNDQVAKRIQPYQKRIEDLSEQQEIQDYIHNKNTYEATMAKCGKNKLPGFVTGYVPAYNEIYKPYDISQRYKLPDNFWGDFGNSDNTTPSIFTENPFKGRLGNIYNYTKILNNTSGGSSEDNDNSNPNARYTGWIPELATQAINLAAFLRHRNSDITKRDVYHRNEGAAAGLDKLAGMRINNYPISKEMRDAERRGAYQIRTTGTSPGQWANQRIALALGTQNNIAKLFSNNQIQNNAYGSDWAKSLLAAGENDRNARMKASIWSAEDFMKSHGARELNASKYMDAIAQTIGQGYANRWKWNQWRDTMSRYDQAYDLENKKLKAYYGLS